MNRFTRIGKLVCLALALAFALGTASAETATYDAVYSSENPIPEIAANVRPSVVGVTVSLESWDPVTRVASVDPVSGGSGCYIQSADLGGYILTNYHVVEEGDVFTIEWLDGTEMECDLVGYDDGTDIAVLKFDEDAPNGALPIPMGDSDELQIGELIIAIGNPGSSTSTLPGTVTAGIVSGLEREANADNFSRSVSVIQIDAAINTGNSGGALCDINGRLIGVNSVKLVETGYEGMGSAIPVNDSVEICNAIIQNGSSGSVYLGLEFNENFTADALQRMGYPAEGEGGDDIPL